MKQLLTLIFMFISLNTNAQFFKKIFKHSTVYTSGEAALNYLTSNFKNKTFFHLGPPRDFGLFNLSLIHI